MLLSILLPVYNEKDTVVQILDSIFSVDWPIDVEVIAVNDGSSDGSREILDSVKGHYSRLHVFHHSVNKGKGSAIRSALAHASGEVITIQDADLEYDPLELVSLIKPILQNRSDVVYGSRFLRACDSPRAHQLVNKFLTSLSNKFTGLHLTDMETCQKVIRREFLQDIRIRSNRFGLEPEITAKLARRGARFTELPISYNFRSYSEGKKITWRDGVKAIFSIIYFRFFD